MAYYGCYRASLEKCPLTRSLECVIMNVGDLVRIKQSIYAPFYNRPYLGEVGIVLEIDCHEILGNLYYVQTMDGVWKFSDYELELLNESG